MTQYRVPVNDITIKQSNIQLIILEHEYHLGYVYDGFMFVSRWLITDIPFVNVSLHVQNMYFVEDDNGLKDNILYESAGSDFDRKPKSTGVEYAVVQKKGKQFQANGDDMTRETALYAEVKKKPGHGKMGICN